MSKPAPVVAVHWEDAEADHEWYSRAELTEKPMPIIKTYGLLVRDDDKAVVIAGSENGGKYGDCTIIPKSLVRKVERFK